jgi:hypothetical protein
MKNIHILPTDKPSSLFEIDGHLIINKEQLIQPKYYRNIYITSDEEISGLENNIWVYNNGRVWLWENTMALRSNNKPKKIILTTDLDLIKNGVQAIDDEFLEWFVKNPSCESVETYSLGIENSDTGESGHYKYEIIIQQEEQIKCYCGHTSYCDCGPQEETKQDQVERMYSEEEVEKMVRAAYTFGEKEFKYFGAFKEWFEQFKKK